VRHTYFEYTDDGWLKKLKCDNAATGQQVTEWIYGVTKDSPQTSELYSNRLVYQKVYPDSTGLTDRVTFTYNRQQQVTAVKDQAATVHIYAFDKLGRPVSDSVTFASGSTVNSTVNKLDAGFNERGLLVRCASYLTSNGSKQNEVAWVYNTFNQPITEYQEHSGAVNTLSSLNVQYAYADGSGNTIRPKGITCPNGNSVSTEYLSTLGAALSRPDAVMESGTVLASLTYLGMGTLVNLIYNAASSAEFTALNGSTGDAGDTYTGLDRFGRLVETIWKIGGTDLVHTSYGRNRVGGVTWKRDILAHALGVATEDHFYWYDGLQQNYRHERGNLTANSSPPPPYIGIDSGTRQQQEIRSFDETGNWLSGFSASPSLNQTRTHNKANEIASLTGPSGVIAPAYDAVGNMTTMPQPGSWATSNTLTWDAWNRLVSINQGSTTITCKYDPLHRRVSKTNSSETRDYYYNRSWRCVEERVSGSVKAQYLWSPIDRQALLRRKRSVSGTLDETLYVLTDYLDPTAVITTGASVTERYSYDSFGQFRVLTSAFANQGSSSCAWTLLFHAEFVDLDVGLCNYGFRFYNPELGRWLSRDPIWESGGSNLYGYVRNNSINLFDVFGLSSANNFVNNIVDTVRDYPLGVAATAFGIASQARSSHNRNTPYDGFKKDFVDGPPGSRQGGQIYAHIFGHLGALLKGLRSVSDKQCQQDWDEWISDSRNNLPRAAERRAEFLDDVAARTIAVLIRDYKLERMSESELRQSIKNILLEDPNEK
jgi:RHS repeat-associated protein